MEWPDTQVDWADRLFPIIFIVFIIIMDKYLRRRRFSNITGGQSSHSRAPVKDPFIGLDFIYERFFRGLPEKGLKGSYQSFRELGSTYTVSRWTSQAIHTCDAENIRHMLATGFEDFELPKVRISVLKGLLGTGIFTLDGQSWSHARAVLRQTLTKQKMDALPAILEYHVQALLRRMPVGRNSFDLQPLLFGFSMDLATEFLMGHSTHILDSSKQVEREKQFVDDYMICSEEATKKMRLGPLSCFRFNAAAERAKKRVFNYIDNYINESLHLHCKGPHTNFMQELAVAIGGGKTLRDQVLHILLASRDTTASLLSNLFFVLAKKPQVYAKLRREVIGAVSYEIPTFDQLRDMQYLKWCVSESLRMHPVIPSNARSASCDTALPRGGGQDGKSPLFVGKGTVVLYNIYTMHRDPGVFGVNSDEFLPERWDGLRPGWSYLPFNGGPRVCLGQQFALLEAYYLVARLVQKFDRMESCDEREWMELSALATTCKNGVLVRLHPSGIYEKC